jgi:hypothetical protein
MFGWLVFASVALNVFGLVHYSEEFRAMAVAQHTAAAGWLVSIVIAIGSNGFFWWRIARRAGNVARWVYVMLVLVSLLQFGTVMEYTRTLGWPYAAMMGGCAVFGLAAIALLFRRDVSRWLRSAGKEGETDPSIFA